MRLAQRLDRGGRALDLLARRHQGGAVLQRPTIILHMRDLDAARAERKRERHHLADALDIGAVHDGVDGQRQIFSATTSAASARLRAKAPS